MPIKRVVFIILVAVFVSTNVHAQVEDSAQFIHLVQRTKPAPEEVFLKFREAGMDPADHPLTAEETKKVEYAFSILPPVFKKILQQHLHSISFMDRMPNTALTSPIPTNDSSKMFNIVFRAEILHQTISQWATWKENTCYIQDTSGKYEVSIDAGDLDAFVYVLLHEATHVADAVLTITPHSEEADPLVVPTAFTKQIWKTRNKPVANIIAPILDSTRFRNGKPIAIAKAPEVYQALGKTPFVSLYSTAAWFEDLAELLAIYHLTEKLDQPFKVSVKKNGSQVATYEPGQNKKVRKRYRHLEVFYDNQAW